MTWWRLVQCSSDNQSELYLVTKFSIFHTWKYFITLKEIKKQTKEDKNISSSGLNTEMIDLYKKEYIIDYSLRCPCNWKLISMICHLLPDNLQDIDNEGRLPLHWSINKNLNMEKIIELVYLYPSACAFKDMDGISPITWSIHKNYSEDLIIAMVIPLAHQVLEQADCLMKLRNWNGCQRMFRKYFHDYFQGVSQFDHYQMMMDENERPNEFVCCNLRSLYQRFIDTCSLSSPPTLIESPPEIKEVVLGSTCTLSVVIKELVASFQWYLNNIIIPGETQKDIFLYHITHKQHKHQYHCEISNWKGAIQTQPTVLHVKDPPPDSNPCESYIILPETIQKNEVVYNIKSSLGGIISSSYGASVFIPPNSFQILDYYKRDVSNTLGLDIGLSMESIQHLSNYPSLSFKEHYISSIVSLRPINISFLQPCILSIQHNGNLKDLYSDIHLKRLEKNEWCDVNSSSYRIQSDVIEMDILTFGTFCVVQRLYSDQHAIHREENITCILIYPETISSSFISSSSIDVYLCPSHPLYIQEMIDKGIQQTSIPSTCHPKVETISFLSKSSPKHILHLFHDEDDEDDDDDDDDDNHENDNHENDNHEDGNHNHESGDDTNDDDSSDVFGDKKKKIRKRMMKWKLNESYECRNCFLFLFLNKNFQNNLKNGFGFFIFPIEFYFSINFNKIALKYLFISLIYPKPIYYPSMEIIERKNNQLTLKLSSLKEKKLEMNEIISTIQQDDDKENDKDDDKDVYDPLFILVEMASMNESFWIRYEKVWWFEEGKCEFIERLYNLLTLTNQRMLHIPQNPFAVSFRLAYANVDGIGDYSPPFLISSNSELKEESIKKDDDSHVLYPKCLSNEYDNHVQVFQMEYEKIFNPLETFHYFHQDIHHLIFNTFLSFNSTNNKNSCHQKKINRLIPSPSKINSYSFNLFICMCLKCLETMDELMDEKIVLFHDFFYFIYQDIFKTFHRLIPLLSVQKSHRMEEILIDFLKLFKIILDELNTWNSKGWLAKFLLILQDHHPMKSLWFEYIEKYIKIIQDFPYLNTCYENEMIQYINYLNDQFKSFQNHSFRYQLFNRWKYEISYSWIHFHYILLLQSNYNIIETTSITFLSSSKYLSSNSNNPMLELLSKELNLNDIQQLNEEYDYKETRQAFQEITSTSIYQKIESHLIYQFPKPQQNKILLSIKINFTFDQHVLNYKHFSLQNIIKLYNITRDNHIQGQLHWDLKTRSLLFQPNLKLEMKCEYQVILDGKQMIGIIGPFQDKIIFNFYTIENTLQEMEQ